eukprot:gene287-9939_t
MRHCSAKSGLMSIQEELNDNRINRRDATSPNEDQVRTAIIDEMAKVQALDKSEWVKVAQNWLSIFSNRALQAYTEIDEEHIIFARYDLPSSLKAVIKITRRGLHAPAYYHIHYNKLRENNLAADTQFKFDITKNYLTDLGHCPSTIQDAALKKEITM